MKKARIEYCIDGYDLIEKNIINIYEQLNSIKLETDGIFKAPFGVDIACEGYGRMNIALSDRTVLCYKSDDLEIQLTAVGDIDLTGETIFYFGDYSLIPNKYLISYEYALNVISDWLESGKLPDYVKWE